MPYMAPRRRRPLSTCGASTLTMVHNMYTRLVELNGPIGSITRRLAKLGSVFNPVVCLIQYQWLAILSFVDNRILTIVKAIETHVPPLSHVFDKLDDMVDKVENLPRKLDELMNQSPVLLHRIPFLDWVVMCAIKWLEFVTSPLVIWGLDHGIKEKEITVDTNFNKQEHVQVQAASSSSPPSVPTETGDYVKGSSTGVPTLKCSYKEALEKGVNSDYVEENSREFGGEVVEEKGGKDGAKGEGREGDKKYNQGTEEGSDEEVIITKEAPLLELFDFGWETPKMNTTMARSASYT